MKLVVFPDLKAGVSLEMMRSSVCIKCICGKTGSICFRGKIFSAFIKQPATKTTL